MVYGRFAKEKQDLDTANELIFRVLTEECDLAADDGEDLFVLTALVFDGAEESARAVGAGRLFFDGASPEIGDVAVLPEYRGSGYGDFLVRLLVDKALFAHARGIRVNARCGTENFFQKIGFRIEGDTYEARGGRWQPMVLSGNMIRSCEACVSPDKDEANA